MNRIDGLFTEEEVAEVIHPENGREYMLLKNNFGTLSDNPQDPLSCVSVANSSLSIDIWRGCKRACAYCHVHSSQINLDPNTLKMPRKVTVREGEHTAKAVIEALIGHPFFIKDKTVLSIGTSSTEPFDKDQLPDTIRIIDEIQGMGLRNPIWVVTKAGIPKSLNQEKIEDISSKTTAFVISLCANGSTREIEPVQNNRFLGAERAKRAGAKLVIYLRPIVEEWGANEGRLREVLTLAKREIGELNFDIIATGGLRWDEGVEYALESRGQKWPESLSADKNRKSLPEHLWKLVKEMSGDIFPGVPIVRHSSCALSTILKQPDLAISYSRKKENCRESECSENQRVRCDRGRRNLEDSNIIQEINERIRAIGLDIQITEITPNGIIVTSSGADKYRYAINRTILKVVAEVIKEKVK